LITLGTAGLLVQAKRAGILPEIAPLFQKLEVSSYWISPEIVNWALQQAGE
jgi:predicted nucleic acid-binding protein